MNQMKQFYKWFYLGVQVVYHFTLQLNLDNNFVMNLLI